MNPDETQRLIESTAQLTTTYLGTRTSQLGLEESVGLDDEKRLTHVLSLGQTGTGKTQLMLHAALQDAHKGYGFCMVIPKGNAVDEVLAKLPEERLDDVVYLNPGQTPVTPINVLEPHVTEAMTPAQKENQKEIIVADLIDLFKRQSEHWGDRFGRVLETLLRAHLDRNIYHGETNTLVDVFRCVVTDDALVELINRIDDPVVREQLVRIREDMSSYEMEPLQRRLNDFIMNPTIRTVIAAAESGVDFREVVNDQRIVLVDVQKGEVGDTVSKLVGSIVITKIWAAAQSRVTVPEAEREPFYLYVDEVHNLAGEGSNFKKILGEAREYRLGCWLATQYLHQLDTAMRRAVSNNCRTKIVFDPSGTEDLGHIDRMLKGVDKPQLTMLGNYRAAVQMPADHEHRQAVVLDTYPPWEADRSDVDSLKQELVAGPASGTDHVLGQEMSMGRGASAGQETHLELLGAAKEYLEAEGAMVTLLYQDGDSKPDGHVIEGEEISHLEAEVSTLSRPVKVLRNVQRAAAADRDVVFVVKAGDATKLENIVTDPVNRRGDGHEDEGGSFDYYTDEDGEPFTAVTDIHDVAYRILEVDGNGRVVEPGGDVDAECPELASADRSELEAFCLYRDEAGFCAKLEEPCTLQEG